MSNFDYKTLPGHLGELIEFRDNSEYPELKDLWWPRYDWECWNYMHKHRIEPDFFDVLMTHVNDSTVMVQAGGNCGQYVRQFGQRFDTVYTFEPDPINFLCLTLNCGNHVIKTQACLGNKHTLVAMNRDQDAGAIHVGTQTGNVPTVRIDDLSLQSCGLIQLDIEGYELFALQGALDTIERCHPVIMVEWYEPWAQRYGADREMLEVFFADLGYEPILTNYNDQVYKRSK
jgi:FkbM family methyltransferase